MVPLSIPFQSDCWMMVVHQSLPLESEINALGNTKRWMPLVTMRESPLPLRELTEFAIANASDQCYASSCQFKMRLHASNGNSRSRLAKFLSGYHHTDQYVLSHPLRPLPLSPAWGTTLTPSAIKACFKSHAPSWSFVVWRRIPLVQWMSQRSRHRDANTCWTQRDGTSCSTR